MAGWLDQESGVEELKCEDASGKMSVSKSGVSPDRFAFRGALHNNLISQKEIVLFDKNAHTSG